MTTDTVLDCSALSVPQEIARLNGIIADLEAKNAALIEESKRLGRLLIVEQNRHAR